MISPILAVLSSVTPAIPPMEMAPDWIHFYGGMRLRLEHTEDQNSDGDARTRGRMRARFGAKFGIADDLKAEVRLSTASGTANNPHWDMGGDNGTDTLSGADVDLDRISLSWMPSDSVTLVAGKMGLPLKGNPVFNEWIWDGDIQPAGIAGIWSFGGDLSVDARLGHFVVDEVNSLPGGTADPSVTAMQVNFGGDTDSFQWDVNTALWNWTGMGAFRVWDTILSARVDDVTGSFEFIQNLDDDTGDDTAYAAGLKYGAGGSQGASQFFGNYFDFDASAAVWGVGQDDTPKGVGPDGLTGFVAGWKYWWRDNVTFKVWALQADDETDDPLRLRFDVDVNFTR